MKGEIDIFKNCPSVKFTSDNPSEILVILKKLTDIIHKRSKQFAACGIKNINQWNKNFPNKKMKRIIIGAEEISFFMEPGSKDEANPFFHYFNDIVKAGRSAGVHFIGLIQRTTAANLGGNGELKSQLTVITAKQRSELDSRNAIDINDAAYLESQEFICSCNDGYVTFKAPTIDEDFMILNKYVPEIKVPEVEVKEKPQVGKKSRILSIEETAKLRENYVCMPLQEYQNLEENKVASLQQNNILPVGTRRPGAVKVGVNNGADR
ncbi:hypothetical protein [Clostridium thermarum]|nr:hypothetical protein [Clostridium thermarum]